MQLLYIIHYSIDWNNIYLRHYNVSYNYAMKFTKPVNQITVCDNVITKNRMKYL